MYRAPYRGEEVRCTQAPTRRFCLWAPGKATPSPLKGGELQGNQRKGAGTPGEVRDDRTDRPERVPLQKAVQTESVFYQAGRKVIPDC
jgi:hypothetical protein